MSNVRSNDEWAMLTDEEFVKAAETQIWFSAFAANNPRAPAHKETDKAYDEACRRGKPWLYKRAWNSAYQLCGHYLSEDDILGAMDPSGEEAGHVDAS